MCICFSALTSPSETQHDSVCWKTLQKVWKMAGNHNISYLSSCWAANWLTGCFGHHKPPTLRIWDIWKSTKSGATTHQPAPWSANKKERGDPYGRSLNINLGIIKYHTTSPRNKMKVQFTVCRLCVCEICCVRKDTFESSKNTKRLELLGHVARQWRSQWQC